MKRHHLYLGTVTAASALLGLWLATASFTPQPGVEARSSRPAPQQLVTPQPAIAFVANPSQPTQPEPPIGRPLRRTASAPPSAPAPATVGTPLKRQQPGHEEHKARDEVQSLAMTLRRYGQRFGGNPVGTNAEITRSLNGGNPAQARLLPGEDRPRLNAKGQLLDPWGTPYFFHQVSATKTEVISAGPDRGLHTSDDLKH